MASLKIQEKKLYITRNCGVLAIFGIPLAIMGLAILQVSNVSIGIYGLGLLLLVLGLIISTGRTGIILDCKLAEMITWSGLWVSFFRKHQSLDGYDKVVLGQQLQSTNKDSAIIYTVQLRSSQSIDPNQFQIYTSTDLFESRAFAEHIADYMDKPLENLTASELLVRQPGEHKKTFLRYSNLEKNINGSLNNQISVTNTASGIEISLLPSGSFNASLIFLPHCIAAIIIGIFIIENVDVEIIQRFTGLITFFILSGMLALIYFISKIGKSVTKILIDEKTIKVYQQTLLVQSEKILKTDELEELYASELTFKLFPMFSGNVLNLASSTQTIDITGIKSTEAVYQLKTMISQSIDFKLAQTQKDEIWKFELQNS